MIRKTLTFILLVSISIYFTACEDKKEVLVKKKQKQYEYFYPASDRDIKNAEISQRLYLPVYSHVYTSEDKYEQMGITLSIRNTDFHLNLLIQKISYYNTKGDLVEEYLDKTYLLKPMASIDFVVDLRDMRGGSGANFIIEYSSKKELSRPIIEAVMVNNSVNRAFGFVTNAYPIK
ncbi:MAG: DUF3124 domain-containing protein [Sphaerochaetaceae bacterium]|nr:DUF3124 domain-containing protein [Sphaerochaetaceae bacterium]